jgi:protein ImuA
MQASPATALIAALRAQVHAIEQAGCPAARSVLPFGLPAVDERLAGGGLAIGALHEAAPASGSLNDDAAASLFLASVAARLSRAMGLGQVLWAITRGDLFAPALANAGLTPDRLFYAECGNTAEMLAVMEEGLRSGGLAAVVGEAAAVPMAALRRLQLAAEESGTTALMLRRWRASRDPLALPSSAITRWRIGSAPAAALPHEGIGRARWTVALARQRGGAPHEWILEAPDAEACLALPARFGDRPDQAGAGADAIALAHAHAA